MTPCCEFLLESSNRLGVPQRLSERFLSHSTLMLIYFPRCLVCVLKRQINEATPVLTSTLFYFATAVAVNGFFIATAGRSQIVEFCSATFGSDMILLLLICNG